MTHLMKIHGGTMYSNWANAAMALHHLDGMETRMKQARDRGEELIAQLNKLNGIKISPLESGTNIYEMEIGQNVDIMKFGMALAKEHNILIRRPNAKGMAQFMINESILSQDVSTMTNAFKTALQVK